MIPRLLKTRDVCGALGVSRRTLYTLMETDARLAPIRIGRTLRWHERKIAEFTDTGSDGQNVGRTVG